MTTLGGEVPRRLHLLPRGLSFLVQRGKAVKKRVLKTLINALGRPMWSTKSYEFWVFLMVFLHVARPAAIVEFGSGRSTSFLAEYAGKTGAVFVSYEQDKKFSAIVRRGLRIANLPDRYVVHCPIKDDWYDLDIVRVQSEVPIEMVFIDGPGGVNNRGGRRDSSAPLHLFSRFLENRAVFFVDDTHYSSVQRSLDMWMDTARADYEVAHFSYKVTGGINSMQVLYPRELSATVRRCLSIVNPVALSTDTSPFLAVKD